MALMAAIIVMDQAVAAPAAPTLQVQFEKASAALVAKKWAEALALFDEIEARPTLGRVTRSAVALRRGAALLRLGRDGDAAAAFRKGLELAPTDNPSLIEDRLSALVGLGRIAEAGYDYSDARSHYEAALKIAPDPAARLPVLLALADVTMFDEGDMALAYADQALAIAQQAKVEPTVEATVRDMRGKVLLNRGNATAALADLEIALQKLGGLTSQTDLADVTVRSDLALAALQAKKADKAREYLAMTGAGRLPDGPFAAPADTDLPPCGGDLRPDDVAVVQFGIGDDGRVSYADPIYASRPGPVAVTFARAVSGWSWRAGDVKSIPLFYRAVTRIELRCSNAVSRPAEAMLLFPAMEKWLSGEKVADPSDQTRKSLTNLREEIAQRKGQRPIERLPYLLAVATSAAAEESEKKAALTEAIAIAEQAKAPIAVMTLLRIHAASPEIVDWRQNLKPFYAQLRQLLVTPAVAADPQSSGVLRLMIAAPVHGSAPSDAESLLRQVADDQRLAEHDPLRTGAMIRIATLQAQRGEMDAARASYLSTGLDAQQCALVDAKPVMRKPGMSSNDYPQEVLRWGMGGWAQIEFDVTPEGRTVNRRAVLAYPPFVFGDPTVKAMESTRYTQTYRPAGATGCSGATQRVRYLMPS